MASVLAVIFSPVANRLEPLVGSLISAALIVLAAVVALVAVGYFLTVELTEVAVEVSGYSDNIAVKLSALEKNTPLWLQRVEHGVGDVEQRLQDTNHKRDKRKPTTVQALPGSPALTEVLKPAVPVLVAVGKGLLVIVLLFFLLYSRRDLRDRFVRLAARVQDTCRGAGHRDRRRHRWPLPFPFFADKSRIRNRNWYCRLVTRIAQSSSFGAASAVCSDSSPMWERWLRRYCRRW